MDNELRGRVAEIISRYRRRRISRRHALRLLGALGLSGVAGSARMRSDTIAQDKMSPMPMGTMEPMGTPPVGPQIDGTTVWKVQVGGMDMETGIDMHAFFPGEVTINAGDSVLWGFAP